MFINYHRYCRVVRNARMLGKHIVIPMSENKTVKIQVQLSEDLRTRFKSKCVLAGTTMNDTVIKLIEDWTSSEESHKQKSHK